MLTRQEALELLINRLKRREDGRNQFVEEKRSIERPFGWLFFVAVAESNTVAKMPVQPYRLIIVNKHSNQVIESSIEYTPERLIQIYEKLLAKSQTQAQNWCLNMSLPLPWRRSGRERLATKAKKLGFYELK